VDLSEQPDLAAPAEPFGLLGPTPAEVDEIRPGLEKALQAVRGGTTAIVDVRVTR
jgi:acetolactate synthase I/II/III large subunit